MSSGGYRGRSFGPHGAHYNNARYTRRDIGQGYRGRDRRSRNNDIGLNNRHYFHENYDNPAFCRRGGRSNNNWSSPRLFSRWDSPAHNPRLPSSSLSSSPSSLSSPIYHNQSPSPWIQNHDGHFHDGPMRFYYHHDSQQYPPYSDHGNFSRGCDSRFSNPRRPQNYSSPYYSAPFREDEYEQQEQEVQQEETVAPLLGSEEERQQKITAAADELKRKLLYNPVVENDLDIDHWEDYDVYAKSKKQSESSTIKLIAELKHGPPELNLTPNDLKDIGKLKENTIDPIITREFLQIDRPNMAPKQSLVKHVQNTHNNNRNNMKKAVKVDSNHKNNDIIDKCSNKTIDTNEIGILKQPATNITTKKSNKLAVYNRNSSAEKLNVKKSTRIDKSLQSVVANQTSIIESGSPNASDNTELTSMEVSARVVTDSSILNSIKNSKKVTSNSSASNKSEVLKIPRLSKSTVQMTSMKNELDLIEVPQTPLASLKIKSTPVSISLDKSRSETISGINNKKEKSDHLNLESSSNCNADNSADFDEKITTIINRNYSECRLQPPPLPPSLLLSSYESEDLCMNAIVPEYDSIRPSNKLSSSPCSTFHQDSAFNSHPSAISSIIPTTSVINSIMNISTPIPGYVMGHQNYAPITPYGVPLSCSPIISAPDYGQRHTPPPPPPLSPPSTSQFPISSPNKSLTSLDTCVSNSNEDIEVFDELKEAMEFAEQCMIMGNSNQQCNKDHTEFPIFPDIPLTAIEKISPKKSKETKKNLKMKEPYQDMHNPHLETHMKDKRLSTKRITETETNINKVTCENITDDPNRPRVVFNLHSKIKKLNKNDDVWVDEIADKLQRKTKFLHLLDDSEESVDKYEKLSSNNSREKMKENDRIEDSNKIKESEKISTKHEISNRHSSINVNHIQDQNQYSIEKKIEKALESLSNNPVKRRVQHLSSVRTQTSVKSGSSTSVINKEKNSVQKIPSSSSRLPPKTILPAVLNETAWKDRVITRFLKMSKNDIQNMINNSSLRKFDIAMRHLVKEQKSSLSLEMRNQEDEKMKSSIYNSEDFMSQLQAILDPAATVDITNLPTNFIHQLSEVLHLDSSTTHDDELNEPVTSSNHTSSKSSTESRIDPKIRGELSRNIETNVGAVSLYKMSKSQKIDNKVCKDTVKNMPTTLHKITIGNHAKVKHGQVDNTKNQHLSDQVTPLSTPLLLLKSENELKINDRNTPVKENLSQIKDEHVSLNTNQEITTTSSYLIDSTPLISSVEKSPVYQMTSRLIPRVETPIVTRVARQAIELDKIFTAGISKAKAASSLLKTTVHSSTTDGSIHDTKAHKAIQQATMHKDVTDNMWRRRGIDDADVYRNLTKEEYEAQYGETSSHLSHEEECRIVSPIQSNDITDDIHRSFSPQRVLQNVLPSAEDYDSESNSQYDSDTDSTSSSSSSFSTTPPHIDVTTVLQFIKEHEKVGKKIPFNEEITDEVIAEMEKHCKDKNIKYKIHKLHSKKRDKRRKEKRVKKKRLKKKRRRKNHHLSYSDNDFSKEEQLPLRLMTENEIKCESIDNDPTKTPQETSKATMDCRQSISTTKISTPVVGLCSINELKESVGTSNISNVPLTTTMSVSTSTSISSVLKNNLTLSSPSLIVTVTNTKVASSNSSESSVTKTALASTVTSPLRTVTVSRPYNIPPQSPILHPKTKAQLKQMPEIINIDQDSDSKIVDPKMTESVFATIGNQVFNPLPMTTSNTSSVSTNVVTTTQAKPRKLDIKTYQERALQRKLAEQEKEKNVMDNPMKLTQNLLNLPTKYNLSNENDGLNFIMRQSTISESNIPKSINNQSSSRDTNYSTIETEILSPVLKNFNSIESDIANNSQQQMCNNLISPNSLPKASMVLTDEKPDDVRADNKFVNIKSEGAKELKLRDKVKKRPHKDLVSKEKSTTIPIHTDVDTKKKLTSITQNERKKLSSATDNIEVAIDNSLSSVNIRTNDAKINYEDKKPSENIDTDVLDEIQSESVFEKNEHLLKVNNVVTVKDKSSEVNLTKNSEQIKIERIPIDQSQTIEESSTVVEPQEEILTFSEYFLCKKELISNGSPNTIAQEEMMQISTQVPEEIKNKELVKTNNFSTISNEPEHQHKNEITTDKETPQILLSNTKAINDEGVDDISQNTDDLLEVMVPPDVVSDLFKDAYEEVHSPISSPITLNKSTISPQPANKMISQFNSPNMYEDSSINLLNTAALSNVDSAISTTYGLFSIEYSKTQNYNQLTLDESSKVSVYEKRSDLISEEKKDEKIIPQNVDKVLSSPCNEISISDKASLPYDCYKSYSQQSIVFNDLVPSLEEPSNSFLKDPITFSNTTLPVSNDDDVKPESSQNNDEREESLMVDNVACINALIDSKNRSIDSTVKILKSYAVSSEPASSSNSYTVHSSSTCSTKPIIENGQTPTAERFSTSTSLDDKVIVNNDDISIRKSNDSFSNKSLREINQLVVESPTSTTRILETNSSGHDESERSSSEARSLSRNFITNHEPLMKSSGNKSSTSLLGHKKRKRHNYDRKKNKLTLECIDNAIASNIVNLISKPTTKNAVMLRMQEIDITIQQLMNEKMRLYQMLQTDEWPVNQNEESTSDVVLSKQKSHLPIQKINKSLKSRKSQIMMACLDESVNPQQSTTIEAFTTKSQTTNTSKNENSETLKTSKTECKNDDKCLRSSDRNVTKTSKKRKLDKSEKILDKNKKTREMNELPVDSSRQKNNSSTKNRNSRNGLSKPTKLSQILPRCRKLNFSVKKCRSVSPIIHNANTSNIFSENVLKTNSSNVQTRKSSSGTDEVLSEVDQGDTSLSKNYSSQNNHFNTIYSDESSWDATDHSGDKHERATGLSLLEHSIKNEMAVKKAKKAESKKKLVLKSQEVPMSSEESDPYLSSTFKSVLNKKSHSKKIQQNLNTEMATKINNHVLKIIDAVAKNRINDLDVNIESSEKGENSSKQITKQSDIEKHNLNIKGQIEEVEKSPIEEMTKLNEKNKDVELEKSTLSPVIITKAISPRPILDTENEYNDEENNHGENEGPVVTSGSSFDKKDCINLMHHDDTSKNHATKSKNIEDSLLYGKINEKNISTSPPGAIEDLQNVQKIDDNVLRSSENKNVSQSEQDHEQKEIPTKIVSKEDWTMCSSQSDTTTSSVIIKSEIKDQNKTSTAIEKPVIEVSTNITMKPNKQNSVKNRENKSRRSESVEKESTRSKSIEKEHSQSKSIVKELECPKSTVKEVELSKSTVKELYDNDSDDEGVHNKKSERSIKRKKQSSNRKNPKKSEDNFKFILDSKFYIKRRTKSPSSRDGSTSDKEQRFRPASDGSSSSVASRKKMSATPIFDVKIDDAHSTNRRGKKRKHHVERTHEQMINCKVQLVDCKSLLQPDIRFDVLHRLGISKINHLPQLSRTETPIQRTESKKSSIINDEERNSYDDDSMEMIQIDDNSNLQNVTSPELYVDIIVKDPLSITPQTTPEYLSSHYDEATTVKVIDYENEDKKDDTIDTDEIEISAVRTLTPISTSSLCEKTDDSELQTMQYTVHKGPILDIKVFGDSFLAASEDGAIYRYCQRSNGILNIYKGHDAAVTCLYVYEVPGTAGSGNTRWNLFSGSLDATLRCYDIVNGSLDRHVADVGSPIQCMDQAWGLIFVGTKSGHISRYDIKSGCLREDNLDFSDKPVLALRASTEGCRRVLIVASRNQPITIRDAQNGLYLRTISGQRNHTVYSLMKDRNLVYCGTSSTNIPVFDFVSGEQITQYTAGVGIVCMRLYRQLLFAGCYDGNIYVFDTKNTKLVCSIPGPGNMLLSMEIVEDRIIAGSKDRRLHAWQMPSQARTLLLERK